MSLLDLNKATVATQIQFPTLNATSAVVDGDGGLTIRNKNSYFNRSTLSSTGTGGLNLNQENGYSYAPGLPDTRTYTIAMGTSATAGDSSYLCNWAGPVNTARSFVLTGGTVNTDVPTAGSPAIPLFNLSATSRVQCIQIAGANAVANPKATISQITVDGSTPGTITWTFPAGTDGTYSWQCYVIG